MARGRSSVSVVEWARDMTERWMRILRAGDGDGTPLDEAVAQVNEIVAVPPPRRSGFGFGRREPPPDPTVVTVLCRQLVTGVLVSDLLMDRVRELTGQSREEILDELAVAPEMRDGQVQAFKAGVSDSCAALRERTTYSGLGARIEDLLRLAEEQATELVEAAQIEADRITAEARAERDSAGDGPG